MQQQGLQPNVITYSAVICAGGLTLQLFDQMRQQGLQPNLISCSAVSMHTEREARMGIELFAQMRQQGIKPAWADMLDAET